jgi:tetratricopeptide (TPR) repeat protein
MLKKLSILVATVLVSVISAFGQITGMRGVVKGVDGKPAVDAEVRIERKDNKGSFKTKTNKKGEFVYMGLQSGTYDVAIFVDNAETDKKVNIRVDLNNQPDLVFDLSEAGKKKEAAKAAAEQQQQAANMSKAEMEAAEKADKARAEAMKKNKELNDAFNVGMTAGKAEQWDEAIAALTKASEIDPKQDVVWSNLAETYVARAKKTPAERDAILAKGIEVWAKAIELKPENAGYRNNFGLALAEARRVKEASDELTKAATLDPPNAGMYYNNLGAVLMNRSESDAAYEAFKKAVEVNPNFAEAHFQIGSYLAGKGTLVGDVFSAPPGTKEAFETYLALAPTGPNADAAKGMLQALGEKIQTSYTNPNAPQKKGAANKAAPKK